jgi:hypothetical protein
MSSSEQAELTYGAAGSETSGWSGTDTSRQRAEEQDINGVTARTQQKVLSRVVSSQGEGRTIAEIRDLLPEHHHGALSGALTNLHRAGKVARLAEKRGRCKVYVLPEYVEGRPTEAPSSSMSQAAYAVRRVLKVHFPVLRSDGLHYCAEDGQRFPCRTRNAIGALHRGSGT